MTILLDTHILLWWIAEDKRLSTPQRRILGRASPEDPLHIADISLWEIATLFELGRIEMDRPLREWLEQASAPPLVQVAPISPAVAAAVAELPESFHRDPADRIIVATAKVLGAKLMTRDRAIIDSKVVATIQ